MTAFVLCRSDAGDGGWSLHAPGSTAEQIADGTARYLTSGPAEDCRGGEWSRPNEADYAAAEAAWRGGTPPPSPRAGPTRQASSQEGQCPDGAPPPGSTAEDRP
jgi:hypothetical protein